MHHRIDYGDPVRVLHLTTSLHIGGAGRLLVRTVAGLDPSVIQSKIGYFIPRRELVPELEGVGVDLVFLDHRGARHSMRTLRSLLHLIDEYRPDVIHTNLSVDRIFGSVAGRIRNVPVVTTLHVVVDGLDMGSPSYRSFARSFTEAYLSRHLSERIIAVGDEVARSHARTQRFDPSRITVVKPGIPPEWLDPVPPELVVASRKRIGATGSPLIVNTARMHPVKNQLVLVEAMQRVLGSYPEAQLIIAGDGELRPALEEKIRELDLKEHVILPGAMIDVRPLLALADVYVTASLREGRSIALLEAMAVGAPIVATRIPEHTEVLRDGETALLAPPGDADRLAERLIEMLDRKDRITIGMRAREEVEEKHTIKGWIDQLEQIYQELTTSRQ